MHWAPNFPNQSLKLLNLEKNYSVFYYLIKLIARKKDSDLGDTIFSLKEVILNF